jgi:hypothetical protein
MERGALIFGNRWPSFFLCAVLSTNIDVLVVEKVHNRTPFDFHTNCFEQWRGLGEGCYD